jgi:hypothetical protein
MKCCGCGHTGESPVISKRSQDMVVFGFNRYIRKTFNLGYQTWTKVAFVLPNFFRNNPSAEIKESKGQYSPSLLTYLQNSINTKRINVSLWDYRSKSSAIPELSGIGKAGFCAQNIGALSVTIPCSKSAEIIRILSCKQYGMSALSVREDRTGSKYH